MTTALVPVWPDNLPTPTPELTRSMTPSDYERHSAQIVASVKACLRNYWQAPSDAALAALEMTDWLSALEDWPVADVQDALRRWVLDHPNKRPNFGHISAALKAQRGKEWATSLPPSPPTEPTPRISKERAAEILSEAGFRPKRMVGA